MSPTIGMVQVDCMSYARIVTSFKVSSFDIATWTNAWESSSQ